MDYVREAIDLLRSYRDLVFSKANLQDEIDKLDAEIKGRAICYKDTPGGSSCDPDEILINKIFRIDNAKVELKETLNEINRIDKVLEAFKIDHEESYKILVSWLIERKSINLTAEQLKISERHIYRLKNQAIRSFAIQLYGIKVPR